MSKRHMTPSLNFVKEQAVLAGLDKKQVTPAVYRLALKMHAHGLASGHAIFSGAERDLFAELRDTQWTVDANEREERNA